jgi:excisionase family DNA binding protein
MPKGEFITIPELARYLGVSRITIYNRVKKGQIPATKVGNTYVITDKTTGEIMGKTVGDRGKKVIEKAVKRTVREYGEVLEKLGKE